MNKRQKELVQLLLLSTDQPMGVQHLADKLGCSERTVRNDLKSVEEFLADYPHTALTRKPGVGIQLSAKGEEKKRILNSLFQTGGAMERDRLLEIGYQLLAENKPLTLQGLARKYFSSLNEIRNDLVTIASWLETFHLKLVSKQRIGSMIEGDELDKRNALAHLSELFAKEDATVRDILRIFPAHEKTVVRQSIEKVLKRWSWQLPDDKVESLVMHALVMIKRVRQASSLPLKEEEIAEARTSREFEMAEEFFEGVSDLIKESVPASEKSYFTWHLIGASPHYSKKGAVHPLVNQVLDQLVVQLQIMTITDFKNDTILLDGLKVHLPSTIHRVRYGLTIRNPMLTEIKKMYPYMFSMVVMALEEVRRKFDLNIPEDEAAYLVLHFQASVERTQKKRRSLKRVLIVCELGIGMSHLLEAKLEQSYKGMEIVACTGAKEWQYVLERETVDFIISTGELDTREVPCLVISPLLKAKDRRKLDRFLQQEDKKPAVSGELLESLRNGVSHFGMRAMHRYQIIERLGNELFYKGCVTKEFSQQAILRERMSSTAIGGGMAIPHAPTEEVHTSSVALAVLDEPVEWGDEQVSVVFLLAVARRDQMKIRSLMHTISRMSVRAEVIQRMKETRCLDDLKEILE